MSIGPAEIVIVLILALLVFGPKRLPQMGKSLGRGVREFKKAADTAKTELGLGEVTDGINDIKSTFTEPVKEVTSTFTDLKKSVDVKSAIEAPVAGAAVAGTAAATVETTAAEPADPGIVTPVVTRPGNPLGAVDPGPETPDVTPATVFADVTPPPEPEGLGAETAPEAPTAPFETPGEPVTESSPAATES
jgi:TatA/E family protein of Tat protein translocase